jgi:hypothetical protein
VLVEFTDRYLTHNTSVLRCCSTGKHHDRIEAKAGLHATAHYTTALDEALV